MDETRAAEARPESGASQRLTDVYLLTVAQCRVIHRALRMIRRETGIHSRTHNLEMLFLDYCGRDLVIYWAPPSPGGKKSAVSFPIYEDQLGVRSAALEIARRAGATDDGAALYLIARELLHSRIGGPDRTDPNPKHRHASGSRRAVPATSGSGRVGTQSTPPKADGPTNASVLSPSSPPGTASHDHRGVEQTPPHRLLPVLGLDRPDRIPARTGLLSTDDSRGAAEALIERTSECINASEPQRLPFTTVPSLAQAVGVCEQDLRNVARDRRHQYRDFYIPKRSGGWRHITAPEKDSDIRKIQDWLVERLLSELPVSSIAFAVRGRSHIKAAKRHARSGFVALLDIRDFHPSIRAASVGGIFREMAADADLADLLVRLTCYDRRLAQGAPSSPKVAELMMAAVDQIALHEGRRRGVSVTRYSDNFTLSGPIRSDVSAVAASIRQVLRPLGLRTHGFSITPRCKRQEVHGLSLNNKVSVPKTYRRKLRDAVRRACRFGCTDLHRQKLLGRINYIGQLHSHEAARLRAAIQTAPKLAEGG